MSSIDSKIVDRQMEDLDVATLAALRQSLQGKLEELAQQEHALRARLAAEDGATSSTSVAGEEVARSAEVDEDVIAMLQRDQTEVNDIQAALDRIAAGTYGACTECGEPIGRARLTVLPQASHCVNCQDVVEHRKGR